LIRQRSLLLPAALAISLAACGNVPDREQVAPERTLVITGIVIRNELPYSVSDVMIEAPASGNFAGCGRIQPRSECSNTFQGIDYRANPVVIYWKEHGQPHQTDEFRITLPENLLPGQSFVVEVVVFAPGQAGARLVDTASKAVRNR